MYYESGAKYFWISLVTSLIVSSIMSFVLILFVSPYVIQKKTKVEVPNLKGMKEPQASLVLKNKDLLLMIAEKKEDTNYEEGVILGQDPLPGFSVEKGSLVKVTINEKSQSTISDEAIPDVRGQDLMLAKERLEKSGYIVGKIEFTDSDTYMKDQVINTDPVPGAKSIKGTIVNIIVSIGIQEITVPNLYRKNISKARNILEKSGLKLGNVRYTTNIEFPFDIIVSQQPTSGTKVKSGSSVDIVVNREGMY
ncbi:PASTA domain-containing protein [candidate division WOR-3 bacterium]|nr:PASTA domain-containing protein [candidate division WOR-3 bacterium]